LAAPTRQRHGQLRAAQRDYRGTTHEASCCDAPTHPATNFVLGTVGSRLSPGTHILALQGINQSSGSSDFHLIPDLAAGVGQVSGGSGGFFSLVTSSSVLLAGSNTMAGSTRVVVNGVDAAFNPAPGTWSKTQSLAPGMNRLFIAALDASGAILACTNKDVIYQNSSTR